MIRNRMAKVLEEVVKFGSRLQHWTWETLEELLDIALELMARLIELILALLNLIFYVVCFLRDLCLGAIQTFANIFHGIVNIVSKISYEEIEDFAAACIVVILWMGAFKFVRNFMYRCRGGYETDVGANSVSTHSTRSGPIEWTNQNASLNSDKDEAKKTCRDVCSVRENTEEQNNQRYKGEFETESDESD